MDDTDSPDEEDRPAMFGAAAEDGLLVVVLVSEVARWRSPAAVDEDDSCDIMMLNSSTVGW